MCAITDKHFGGQGSFFASWPTCGSFEVNPPFDKESVAAAYRHINAVLNRAAASEKETSPAKKITAQQKKETKVAAAASAGGDEEGEDGEGEDGSAVYSEGQIALWSEIADESVVQQLMEMGAGAWCRAGCMRACVATDNNMETALDWCMEHAEEISAAKAPAAAAEVAIGDAAEDKALLYVVVAPRSVDFKQDRGFQQCWILKKVHLDPHRHVFTRGFQHRNTQLWVCVSPPSQSFLALSLRN